MHIGTVKTVFYEKSQQNPEIVECSGKVVSHTDSNEEKQYKFSFTMNNNALLVRDIVSFEINENNNVENIIFKEAPIIVLDNEEVITKIKETNEYLSIVQMRNPRINDGKGYDNKFVLGLKLIEMWNNSLFVKDNKNLLLQVTASLLVCHIDQSKKISKLLNEKYFNDILPYYDKLKKANVISSIRDRSKILKDNFKKYDQKMKSFYCNYIEDDNESGSLMIYSYKQENIQTLIKTCNILTFSVNQKQPTPNHSYLSSQIVDNKIIYVVDISNLVIQNNSTLQKTIFKLKPYFTREKEFTNLTNKININTSSIKVLVNQKNDI